MRCFKVKDQPLDGEQAKMDELGAQEPQENGPADNDAEMAAAEQTKEKRSKTKVVSVDLPVDETADSAFSDQQITLLKDQEVSCFLDQFKIQQMIDRSFSAGNATG